MSKYTTEDVELWGRSVEGELRERGYSDGDQEMKDAQAIIAAALEGVKVPGLVEQVATCERIASALQSRVAELERERDEARRWEETHRKASQDWEDMFNATLVDRDALRDEVAALRGLMGRARDLVMRGGSANYCAAHALLHDALSAPPPAETTARIDPVSGTCSTCGTVVRTAETTCVDDEDHCPRGDHPVWEHERDGKHPLCGTDAETTPAPERAEGKRSCNLHADCSDHQ